MLDYHTRCWNLCNLCTPAPIPWGRVQHSVTCTELLRVLDALRLATFSGTGVSHDFDTLTPNPQILQKLTLICFRLCRVLLLCTYCCDTHFQWRSSCHSENQTLRGWVSNSRDQRYLHHVCPTLELHTRQYASVWFCRREICIRGSSSELHKKYAVHLSTQVEANYRFLPY